MAELIEVVLEDVPKSKVYETIEHILGDAGEVMEVQCSEQIADCDQAELSEKGIKSFLELSEQASILVNVDGLKIGKVTIPSVLLRIVKYEDSVDIDFNFSESDLRDITTADLMSKIHAYVADLGKRYGISHWFGGMEPASDEDTRYFTGDEVGPLAMQV